jgi:transcriptional regulator with XRE-family HTH domain
MVIVMSLSERIKMVRLSEELSLAKFGVKINETKGKIYNIESEKQKIQGEILQQIIAVYDINPRWLLTGKGEMYQSKLKKMTEKPDFSEITLAPSQQNLIKKHRKANITAFIEHWFETKSMDEQAWFEVQLGHSFPQYPDFINSKETEAQLRSK